MLTKPWVKSAVLIRVKGHMLNPDAQSALERLTMMHTGVILTWHFLLLIESDLYLTALAFCPKLKSIGTLKRRQTERKRQIRKKKTYSCYTGTKMDHKKLQVQIKDNCQKHIKFKGKVRQRLWILSRRMDMIDMEVCELDCVIFLSVFYMNHTLHVNHTLLHFIWQRIIDVNYFSIEFLSYFCPNNIF